MGISQVSQETLERLIARSTDIVVATDRAGRVIYYNDGASRILGYKIQEILGHNVVTLYPSLAEAKRALMADVHTQDQRLRLQVQWTLGRVSDDPDVVDVLLENMQRDPVPLFRDKAACALASDQIHLAPAQRLRLFEGLIHALDSEIPQVRQIALQALQILTGQTKGFLPGAEPEARRRAVGEWKQWLAEYRSNL